MVRKRAFIVGVLVGLLCAAVIVLAAGAEEREGDRYVSVRVLLLYKGSFKDQGQQVHMFEAYPPPTFVTRIHPKGDTLSPARFDKGESLRCRPFTRHEMVARWPTGEKRLVSSAWFDCEGFYLELVGEGFR